MSNFTDYVVNKLKVENCLYLLVASGKEICCEDEGCAAVAISRYLSENKYEVPEDTTLYDLIAIINEDDFLRQQLSLINLEGTELLDVITQPRPVETVSDLFQGYDEC
jgi:hypothetical protein